MPPCAYPTIMVSNPADRIEQALVRIEAAGAAKSYALDRLGQRHARLRSRIEQAVASLDTMIARETAEGED